MGTRALLTIADARKHGRPAPTDIAQEIVDAGLAPNPDDVVLVGDSIFARAATGSDEPGSFYLKIGELTPSIEGFEIGSIEGFEHG